MWKAKNPRRLAGYLNTVAELGRFSPAELSGFFFAAAAVQGGTYSNGTRVSDGLPKMFVSVNDHQIDNVAFVCPGAKLRQKRGKLRVDMLSTEAMA
jgi:hypothetical protein